MVKYCVLDEEKVCDNCMKCLDTCSDYRAIEIDEIQEDEAGAEAYEQLRRDLAETGSGEEPFDCFKEKQAR